MSKGTEKTLGPLVICPFCKKEVRAKTLADHARHLHTKAPKFSKQAVAAQEPSSSGVEVRNPDLVKNFKRLVVDESGILINPDLLKDEPRKSLDQRLGSVSLPDFVYIPTKTKYKKKVEPDTFSSLKSEKQPKSVNDNNGEKFDWLEEIKLFNRISKAFAQTELIACPICKSAVRPKRLGKHFGKAHPKTHMTNELISQLESRNMGDVGIQGKQGSKKPEFVQKQKQLNNQEVFYPPLEEEVDLANLVKCPLCKHKTKYNVLFVHIQVSHSEVNPKIVMSKFNKAHKNNNSSDKSKYEEELNELAKDYERLKQSQDESRDGGKYLGFMRREQGKFGSLPLYDDYSDEANSG